MYGHESKPCMVYEYGCLAPTSGEDVLLAEMRRRNDLWNKLVEIDRAYRAKVREVIAPPEDPVAPLLEELASVQEEIKQRRKRERSGRVDVTDLQARASDLRTRIKEARQLAREERKRLAEVHRGLLDALDSERKQAVLQAKRGSGLYWTNADDVLASYETARKKAMRAGTDLKFHPWRGEGKIFIRYQHGLPVPGLFGGDTKLQIAPVSQEAWDHPQRSVRRKAARTRVLFRVTSENRKPVWIELPMVMHRPIPAESEVRSAAIIRTKVGDKFKYKLTITATIPENSRKLKRHGIIGIDLGWRIMKDGLRVAYWADNQNHSGELRLESRTIDAFAKLPDLQSIRDTHFNDIKKELTTWLAANSCPEWLQEATGSLEQWRSPRRLAGLITRWRENRFSGDEEIMSSIEQWLARENHLYHWQVNLQDQLGRRRREEYRKFAAWVANNYDKVVLEDFDLRQMAQKPKPEEGTSGSLPMDRQRVIASVSTLRQAIDNACRREGTEIIYAQAARTTIQCHKCGHVEKYDAANSVWHTCPKCGDLHDQDFNAAMNLVQYGLSQIDGDS